MRTIARLIRTTWQLFRLRSIEQNELTMVTESQNRALFIFTTVTVVFLPLSFFTSYFGMNLVDVRETNLTQGGFWSICGTIAIATIVLTALAALQYQAHSIRKAVGWFHKRQVASLDQSTPMSHSTARSQKSRRMRNDAEVELSDMNAAQV